MVEGRDSYLTIHANQRCKGSSGSFRRFFSAGDVERNRGKETGIGNKRVRGEGYREGNTSRI